MNNQNKNLTFSSFSYNDLQDSNQESILRICLSERELSTMHILYDEIYEHLKFLSSQEEQLILSKLFGHKIFSAIPSISKALEKLAKRDKACAVFIEGLPEMTGYPEQVHLGEFLSLVFASILGEPFQYLQQNDSKLVAHIYPKEGFESTQSGFSRDNFGWHTDDRFFQAEFRTEWIQLFGIYNPQGAETIISPISEIITRLPDKVLSVLMQKRFEVKMPTSFGFKSSIWSEPLSLIWMNEGQLYEVGIPTYNVRPAHLEDQEASDALALFFNIIDQCKQSFTITSGSMLIFNNNRLLHGRTAIKGDRLILRTYIRPDLTALRKQTYSTGHIFDARMLLL